MIIGKVLGSVVSTIKSSHFHGKKLMIVQPVDLQNEPMGIPFLAVDVVDAGTGDFVLVNKEGSGARLIFEDEEIPLQAVIVGVIDDIELKEGDKDD
jgi:microcompartment protein CcmK/EutM